MDTVARLTAAAQQHQEIAAALAKEGDPWPVRVDRLRRCIREDQTVHGAAVVTALETQLAKLSDELKAVMRKCAEELGA